MPSPLGRVPDGRPQSGGSACTDFHGSTLVNARQVTRPQAGESETTAQHDLARAGTSRVLIVTSRHKVCHVAFAQNVAITRSPSSKLTGIDVVVNRLCRDAQCVGSLGNRHALCTSVICRMRVAHLAGAWQRSTMPSGFRRVCCVLHPAKACAPDAVAWLALRKVLSSRGAAANPRTVRAFWHTAGIGAIGYYFAHVRFKCRRWSTPSMRLRPASRPWGHGYRASAEDGGRMT
jgi:hypothetical protein